MKLILLKLLLFFVRIINELLFCNKIKNIGLNPTNTSPTESITIYQPQIRTATACECLRIPRVLVAATPLAAMFFFIVATLTTKIDDNNCKTNKD